MSYSTSELEAMMVDLESDLVERKESFRGDAPTKIREAVCAFANDLPAHRKPGVVFIGVRDDGAPTNLPITDELLRNLADVRSDGNIVPPPTMVVQKQQLSGSEVAVMTVTPSDSPPVRFKGRTWVRIGPRRDTATAQDERILSERRRHNDKPYDIQPLPSAALDDLSRDTFENEYLPNAVAREVLEANERSYIQRLAAMKMIAAPDDPTPTILGLLVLSPRTRDFLPGAYVQFLRIHGTELSDPIADEALIDGPLSDVVRRVDEKLQAHLRTAVDLTSEPKEQRSINYPRGSLQQLARNAIMHRSYDATSAPVRITWYDDRIEISNPGGPFGVIRQDNFGTPGLTDYRNPNLAEAMRVLGFVQRYGVGIATARRLLEDNGNPPLEFTVQPTFIGATVRARA